MVDLSARNEGQTLAIVLVLAQLLRRLPEAERNDIREFVEERLGNLSVMDGEAEAVRDSIAETLNNIFTAVAPRAGD
ncbi:MAG: hypothetical protein DI604_24570 [Delftia acidovorans]|nr:MAG: hypothetical protein DI604_24570 [Delftia acidovorans]